MILLVIIGLFASLGRNTPLPASNNEDTPTIPQTNSTATLPSIPDTITKNLPVLHLDDGKLKEEPIKLGDPIKSNNNEPDLWNGFNERISSLNTDGFPNSDYRVKNTNPKEISGVYFIRYIDSVPILYHIPSRSDTLE